MRSIPDIVQINIYGLTLSELLKKNINIPYILSQHGVTECVVFDLPRNNHISEMNSTDFSISSLNVPERNQETMDIIVKEEVQDFHQHRPAVVCSSPAFPKYKDLLLNCSYSSIYYDDILQNDMAMFDNLDILDLSSITEEESDDSEMEEFHSVREDDFLSLPTNSIQDLLNEILEKVENGQNLSKSKVEFISESECYYSAEYDHFEDAEEIDIVSDEQISTSVIENNDKSFEKNLECITELLNELLDKVVAEVSNNKIYIEEEDFYMAEDDLDIFGGEFEIIDYGNMINEEQHNIPQVQNDYDETLIEENPPQTPVKVIDTSAENNLSQKYKRKSSEKDNSLTKVPKKDTKNNNIIDASENTSPFNYDLISPRVKLGRKYNDEKEKFYSNSIRRNLHSIKETGEKKVIDCCYKNCTRSITLRYGYGRDRLVSHARTHMDKGKITFRCQLCDFGASQERTIRDHHKRVHDGESWKGAKKLETVEDFKELVDLFKICFPGWDAKLRVDSLIGKELPDVITHNKYLGIEALVKFNNKAMQLESKRPKKK